VAELAVTDTHALVWYATGVDRKLGRRARRLFERADAGRAAIFLPAIVLVEIAENVQTGRIRLEMPFVDWEEALFSSARYFPVELNRAVVRASEGLYGIPERGDRLIAGTAVHLGCPLITRDPEIGRIAGLEVIW